jgi:hypothetical protein
MQGFFFAQNQEYTHSTHLLLKQHTPFFITVQFRTLEWQYAQWREHIYGKDPCNSIICCWLCKEEMGVV